MLSLVFLKKEIVAMPNTPLPVMVLKLGVNKTVYKI